MCGTPPNLIRIAPGEGPLVLQKADGEWGVGVVPPIERPADLLDDAGEAEKGSDYAVWWAGRTNGAECVPSWQLRAAARQFSFQLTATYCVTVVPHAKTAQAKREKPREFRPQPRNAVAKPFQREKSCSFFRLFLFPLLQFPFCRDTLWNRVRVPAGRHFLVSLLPTSWL